MRDGAALHLEIGGIDFLLAAVVRSVERDHVHVTFAPAPEQQDAFRGRFGALVQGLRPIETAA